MMFFASFFVSMNCEKAHIEPVAKPKADTTGAVMIVSEWPTDTTIAPTVAVKGYITKKDSTIIYLGANRKPIEARWIVWGYIPRG